MRRRRSLSGAAGLQWFWPGQEYLCEAGLYPGPVGRTTAHVGFLGFKLSNWGFRCPSLRFLCPHYSPASFLFLGHRCIFTHCGLVFSPEIHGLTNSGVCALPLSLLGAVALACSQLWNVLPLARSWLQKGAFDVQLAATVTTNRCSCGVGSRVDQGFTGKL